MSYSELLRSPQWQRRRLEIMQRDEFKCRFCGEHRTTLNVHHIRYLEGLKPWEYKDEYLITLCEPCHGDEEKLKSEDGILVAQFIQSGIPRRRLYPVATELRRYFEDINNREKRYQDLMEFLAHG